ncbi:hypothetical protein [Lapidilactobacillus wuchangensis]|uniref:hypothetical protein n=1 Tax=Lapidilactobacillus wuchangensis TaxID=2486001 RepID=UPI000F78B950|nr:hypothetical protein [Lapidilactobacillus wuchangensis]
MFSFKRKKSTESQEFDFAKMMANVREDPKHLEQVQAHYKEYYHQYPKKSNPVIDSSAKSAKPTQHSNDNSSVNSSVK